MTPDTPTETVTADPPADERTHDCPYCGRPFATAEYRRLHVGLDHPDDCTESEVEAFRDAYREESERLRLFRLKAIGGIVVLYFGFLFTYSLVT